MIKNNNRGGFTDRQCKGVGVGEVENRIIYARSRARPCELADVFEKNEKKNKTTSVFRLAATKVKMSASKESEQEQV